MLRHIDSVINPKSVSIVCSNWLNVHFIIKSEEKSYCSNTDIGILIIFGTVHNREIKKPNYSERETLKKKGKN
jgi:hypothetical protein